MLNQSPALADSRDKEQITATAVRRLESWDSIREVNKQGPYVGLITVYQTEEKAFFASGAFEADPKQPFVVLSGRLFRVGTIYDNRVIYVRCGEGMFEFCCIR